MIIAIVGPTGVGKTKLSILLAKKYNAIIINCDAMQVYKEFNIGVAKIKKEEQENINHYLFDIKSVNETFSVYEYQKELRIILDDHSDQNIIIVGGTGLYLKAGLFDYQFNEYQSITDNYDELSNDELYDLAMKKDQKFTGHINNRKRIINFLRKANLPQNKNIQLYDAILIGLTLERKQLYEIINRRVDIMIEDGLINEVKELFDQGINSTAINTAIGYKELYEYFNGDLSLDEAIDLIKKNTRHYVKRQYTWFKNQMNINWFNVNIQDFNKTTTEIINYIETLDK